jgi:hypothetical protein
LAEDGESDDTRAKDAGTVRILSGPALTLRLRAGFGMSAKADLLSLLLGLGGDPADLNTIAEVTAYSQRTIRNATAEMTLAGFVHEIEGRPSSFHVTPESWRPLLSHGKNAPDAIIPSGTRGVRPSRSSLR